MSEMSRQEAVAGRRKAGQSAFLALIATIFLPMTSVAVSLAADAVSTHRCSPHSQTIFAVPAFKFENYWLDGRFSPVNGSAGGNGTGTPSPSDSPKPVFSGYGIIYILISVSLTCVTVLAYLRAKRRFAREDDDEPGFVSVDQAADSTAPATRPVGGVQEKGSSGSNGSSSLGASLRALPAAVGPIKSWPGWQWVSPRVRSRRKGGTSGGSPV
jgi:hypothetical protein